MRYGVSNGNFEAFLQKIRWNTPKRISDCPDECMSQSGLKRGPIDYTHHIVRIQCRTRNPYKQASALVRNLENCYNIRNNSVMLRSSSERKNKGENNKRYKHRCNDLTWCRLTKSAYSPSLLSSFNCSLFFFFFQSTRLECLFLPSRKRELI